MSGEKTLASGNVMRWSAERGAGRVAYVIEFTNRPSEADTAEALKVTDSLQAPGATRVVGTVHYGGNARQRCNADRDAFLGRGSAN